jgi:NADH dehydrogenase
MPAARFAPVHVDDVAAAIATVLARPDTAGRSLDLCGPDEYSLRDLVAMTATALGLRRAVVGLSPGVSRLQAAVMDFVPGKPFSTDNYRSLLLPSVCAGNGFATLGLPRRSLPAHLATTLGVAGPLTNFDSYRRRAGR